MKDDIVVIESKGKSSHGACPEEGINAIAHIMHLLQKFLQGYEHDKFLEFFQCKIGFETSGQSLGIDCSDELSGKLTLNIGKISIKDNMMKVAIDIRYPISFNGDEIVEKIKNSIHLYGMKVEILQHKNPLYVSENDKLIIRLQHAYEKITHQNAGLISIGGGTYARKLNNKGVAFGGVGSGAHQANENICIDELMKHAKICTQAIYELSID